MIFPLKFEYFDKYDAHSVLYDNKRITLMLDNDLEKKLSEYSSKKIYSTASSVSFSKIINEVLRKSLKK